MFRKDGIVDEDVGGGPTNGVHHSIRHQHDNEHDPKKHAGGGNYEIDNDVV